MSQLDLSPIVDAVQSPLEFYCIRRLRVVRALNEFCCKEYSQCLLPLIAAPKILCSVQADWTGLESEVVL